MSQRIATLFVFSTLLLGCATYELNRSSIKLMRLKSVTTTRP